MKEQLEYEAKKKAEDDAKKERIREQKKDIAEHLSQQIKNREERERARIAYDRAFRKHLIEDAKLAEQRELKEAKERRLKMLEQAEFLEKQMEYHQRNPTQSSSSSSSI